MILLLVGRGLSENESWKTRIRATRTIWIEEHSGGSKKTNLSLQNGDNLKLIHQIRNKIIAITNGETKWFWHRLTRRVGFRLNGFWDCIRAIVDISLFRLLSVSITTKGTGQDQRLMSNVLLQNAYQDEQDDLFRELAKQLNQKWCYHKEQLHQIMPYASGENLESSASRLTRRWTIPNKHPQRMACFPPTMHESGCWKYVKELATGQAYEGRKDLGNIELEMAWNSKAVDSFRLQAGQTTEHW